MSTDPAVEAARRAWEQEYPGTLVNKFDGVDRFTDAVGPIERFSVAAAREALAPLRAHIEDARKWKPYDTRDIGEAYLADAVIDLLDELSRLIYPSEELK